jgi:hypothetical protein
MTKGMTAALAAATVSLGLPASAILAEASSVFSAAMATTGLPAVTVFTDSSSAVAIAQIGGGGRSFGQCVANEEITERDGPEAVVDCA